MELNLEEVRKQHEYFKAVKKSYRKGPLFERIKKKDGKPDWDKIRNYTSEELIFLVALGVGNTMQQREEHKEFYEQKNFDMPLELFKKKMKSSWRDLAKALGNKEVLQDAMDKEAELKKTHVV